MVAETYVIGHKNPDSDAICAAVGYAAFATLQGQSNVVAARQGALRRETAYILDRFGVPVPVLVTDVRTRVSDVMTTSVVAAHIDASLYAVSHLLRTHDMRLIPIVDDRRHLCGVITIEDFAQVLIDGMELTQIDRVPLHLENVVETLKGQVLVQARQRSLRDHVMVGAMKLDSMLSRIEPDILLVMGDRVDAQRAAIKAGVGALVITGNSVVSEETLDLARAHNVTVVSVSHNTYTTVRLIHMSMPVRYIMRSEVPLCRPDDVLEDVREQIQGGPERAAVVIHDDKTIAGLVSRSDLLRSVRRRVVLVDHNERGQAVAGIDEAEVVGVIDHHRVAEFQTRTPPFMRFEPVGATSTIVAKLFVESGITIPPAIAGVLLSGILADTLLFRGPTTTEDDRRLADLLARRAGVDADELGDSILHLASDVSDRSAEQLLMGDFKDFGPNGRLIGIGVIETTNRVDVLARSAELLVEMRRLRERGYLSVLLVVVDIMERVTTILIVGHAEKVAETFGALLINETMIKLPGILSRKKNIVPQLGTLNGLIADGNR